MFKQVATGKFGGFASVNASTKWALASDATLYNSDVWSFGTISHNGTQATLFFNGTQPAQTFAASVDKTIWFTIAGVSTATVGALYDRGAADFHWAGQIGPVLVTTSAMTLAQHTALYQQTRHLLGV